MSLFTLLFLLFSPTLILSFTQQEEDQIHRFQHYLQIPTAHPNPNYAAAASFLSTQAQSIGLHIQTLEFAPGKPLLILTYPGSNPSLPSILLNSHIDSVPAEPDKWLHPPFAAHRDSDGRIFARGTQDDKCLAVQYLEALRSLKAADFSPLRSIHVSLVPDEEIGGADGAAKFAASEEFRRLNVGFVLDEGQASPTGEFRVFYADRSPWSLIVRAVGPPGHGSKMFDNGAMENLMDCVEAVARFRKSQFDFVKAGVKAAAAEVISVNPVYMKAGTQIPTGFVMNMQPSEAEVGFDVRLPPTADLDFLIKRIDEWAPPTRNMTYELIQKGPIRDNAGRPLATATNESNPWWSVFQEAIIASGGKLAKPEILPSTTDARFMRQLGIPSLGFSPMANTPILLHEHNEFLKDTVFLKGIKVYEHVISSLSSLSEISL